LSGNKLVWENDMKFLEALKTRWVVWVWQHTPTCAEMSRLASQSLDRPLPLGLRLRMRLHYVICVWCARYLKHLRFLHRAAPRLVEHEHPHLSRPLSAEAKQRMVQKLRETAGC
jgi:hypothetical protein